MLLYIEIVSNISKKDTCLYKICSIGPTLNEKLFPVHRPSGLKRADWNFFFIFFFSPLFFFSTS